MRQLDGPVAADYAAERQAARRIEYRAGQAHILHEIDPTLAADLGKSAGREGMCIGRVQVIVGWIGTSCRAKALAVLFGHPRGDFRMGFYDMAVAVDDFMLIFSFFSLYCFLGGAPCAARMVCFGFQAPVLGWGRNRGTQTPQLKTRLSPPADKAAARCGTKSRLCRRPKVECSRAAL